MNTFQSIRLQNTSLYKNVEFKVPKGLSVIYGLNKTSKHSKNGNGVGKSYLFSQLREILYAEPSVGTKADRVTKGTRELKMRLADGRKVTISRNNSKVEIECDGKVQNRTVTQATKWIQENIPISPDEFDTHVYIDSRVGHPLVLGSNAQRKAFFTSFFQLDKIDEERKLVGAELRRLKNIREVYLERVKDYKDLSAKLKGKQSLKELKVDLTKKKAELESLQAKQEGFVEHSRIQTFLKAGRTPIKAVQAHVDKITEESLQELKLKASKKLKQVNKSLQDAKDYEYYLRDLKKYEAQQATLNPSTQALLEKYSRKELLAKEQQYKEAVRKANLLKEELSEVIKKPTKVSKPSIDKDVATKAWAKYTNQLEHIDKFGKGVCSTCGQDVALPNVKDVKVKLKKAVAALESHKEYNKYKQAKKEYKKANKRVEVNQANYKELVKTIKQLREFKGITETLSNLVNKPAPFKGKKVNVIKATTLQAKLQDLLRHIKFLEPNVDMLSITKTKAPIDYSKQITKLNKEYSMLRADYEVVRTYSKQLAPMKEELVKQKESLKDEKSLTLLLQAYGDKASKKLIVDNISEHLVKEVNRYARLVFPEHFVFDFSWGNTVTLNVTRKNGNKLETTDVRKLSGGEYRLFTLVLVLALLAFVPPSKRSSLLVLDEPTANMHEETAEGMKRILNAMTKLIPSVVVITPHDTEHYKGAKNFTVIKEKGVARLEPEHPQVINSKLYKVPS